MDNRITKTHEYILTNLRRPLSMEELAEVACMSRIHFQRVFKDHYGMSPGMYIEVNRIRKSLDLLKKPLKVADIAAEVGYFNYETFSRSFKKYCRIAPGELQHLIHVIENETELNSPVVTSFSRDQEHLAALVEDSLSKKVILEDQLKQLQVCIIKPKYNAPRSRKVEDKFTLNFETDLAHELMDHFRI